MAQIELDLEKHCIETAVKRLHNRLVSQYFRSKGSDPELEEKLALLQKALACFDFPSLRAAHKALAGKTHAKAILAEKGRGTPCILLNGRPIEMGPFIIK